MDDEQPLHAAAESGDDAEVTRLLGLCVDPNSRDAFGDTPLHAAASMGHTETVKLLCDHAVLDARNLEQALEVAKEQAHAHRADRYVEGSAFKRFEEIAVVLRVKILERDALPSQSFFEAAMAGDAAQLEAMCLAGQAVDATDPEHASIVTKYRSVDGPDRLADVVATGFTSLCLAVWKGGELPAVQTLLRHGASVSVQAGLPKWSALHIAAYEGRLPIVKALIAASAPLEAMTEDAWGTLPGSPLHHAVHQGHTEVAWALINAGASINAPDFGTRGGLKPLHVAAKRGHLECVKALIAAGADECKQPDWFRPGNWALRHVLNTTPPTATITATREVVERSRPETGSTSHEGAETRESRPLERIDDSRLRFLLDDELRRDDASQPCRNPDVSRDALQPAGSDHMRIVELLGHTHPCIFPGGESVSPSPGCVRSWRLLRKWRIVARAIGVVMLWNARTLQRRYAPGGSGYLERQESWSRKVQRTS